MEHDVTVVSGTVFLETYSAPLILLSVLIAIFSAFTAFGTSERQYNSSLIKYKIAWNIFGATAMGLGIWAMHFIGMLAFSLPIPISYDVFITVISVIPAILACSVVLWMMTQKEPSRKYLMIGGVLLGSGIGLMHYTGMAAMRMNAVMVHDLFLFYLSILVAIVLATVALIANQHVIKHDKYQFINKKQIISAVVMGLAASGMHYIAMASVDFYPQTSSQLISGIGSNTLTLIVSAVVLVILLLAISIPVLLRYKQTAEELDDNLKRMSLALGVAKQGWVEFEPQTGGISVSNEYARMIGFEPTEFKTNFQEWQENVHPDDLHDALAAIQKMLEITGPVEHEYRRQTKNGDWIWLHSIGEVIKRDKSGRPTRVIGIKTDITERKQSEQVLRVLAESGAIGDENIFKLMVKQLAISQNTRYAIIAKLNPAIAHQVNVIASWIGGGYGDDFSYSLIDTPCENIIEHGRTLYPNHIQSLFPNDRMLVDMEAESYLGVPLINSHGEVIGLLALIDDKPMVENTHIESLLESLAVRAAIELERIESNKKLNLTSRVFGDTHDGILITDKDSVILDVNPAFCGITGYSREEVIGKTPRFLSSGKQAPEFYTEMWSSINEHDHWVGEVWNRKKNGDLYAEWLTISALKNSDGETINYLGIFSDITENKKQQKELEKMAHFDLLTQLPNRALFSDRFSRAIAHSKRSNSLLAICFLDLDDFKPVNDNYGHEIGDYLLVEVAERLKSHIREEDTVSRQGGDEFALLLGDLESFEQCEQMLERLQYALSRPYIIDGHNHNISASIGITLYPNDNSEPDTLMRHADQAMYQAKVSGRGNYHVFNTLDDKKVLQKQNQLQEIQQALVNNEFCLFYQPKVNMSTGKAFGVEALIRWNHPSEGLVPPFKFLPIIEGTELEIQFGDWVINEALRQLNEWRQQGVNLEVSINIASHHLQSESFLSHLDNALEKYPKINSQSLQLEILESSALGDLANINNIIKICREVIGVQVALDDFGTSYSSLTHLRSLPASVIKIDQSFVRNMLEDPNDCAIIEGVIGLANSFNRKVIAEGVETLQQGLMLMLMGCDRAQGYYVARPMPADNIAGWLKNYRPNKQWMNCGKTVTSPKDKKLQLFQLTTQQWVKRFEKNIHFSQEDIEYWPIMEKTECPCGQWIRRESQDILFDSAWLASLRTLHDDVHRIADKLKEQYLSDNMMVARRGLAELQSAFERMRDFVQSEFS